jgi:hypothetical protein
MGQYEQSFALPQSDRGGALPTTVVQETPLERLEAEITELSGHLTAAEYRWLVLIGEYDRREGRREWGCRSCATG